MSWLIVGTIALVMFTATMFGGALGFVEALPGAPRKAPCRHSSSGGVRCRRGLRRQYSGRDGGSAAGADSF